MVWLLPIVGPVVSVPIVLLEVFVPVVVKVVVDGVKVVVVFTLIATADIVALDAYTLVKTGSKPSIKAHVAMMTIILTTGIKKKL